MAKSTAFWEQVDKSGDCWIWTGAQNRNGYGLHRFYDGGRERREVAHRTAWRLSGRALDPLLTLDHLCRVRLCVRPDHLEQVTMRENLMRGLNPAASFARRDSCGRGHPYTDETTAWSTYESRRPWRRCKACDHEDYLRRKARLSGLSPESDR